MKSTGRGWVVVAALGVAAASPASNRARAQEPLTRNDFAIDLVDGPVLGSGRIVGLGGAYTAIAEGIDELTGLERIRGLGIDYAEGKAVGPCEPFDAWLEGAVMRST